MSKLVLKENSVEILGSLSSPRFNEILNWEALEFVAELERQFGSRRKELLALRAKKQAEIERGEMPTFLANTERIRNSSWKIRGTPKDLVDRRVEITGPSGDTKMVINALNSGANVYMADFEDSQSPTWQATIQGQVNLFDAIRRSISYVSPEGKRYSLNKKTSTLIVRPRGLHLDEEHFKLDGVPVSASIFDFALFFFHNAKKLIEIGTGPYFYLPKMESHLEARLWNDIFAAAEKRLGLPVGTIKVTVLIETILAAFEMDEILYELRDYITGLNCGRWDYIFSFIKKFRNDPSFVLPDRALVTMDKAFLAAYVSLLIKTCHKRGAHAMGGMAAQIPIKNNEEANLAAMEKVRADKLREVSAGHDGTWVAHPGLVALAKQVFDSGMNGPNQIDNLRGDVSVSGEDLLRIPKGEITLMGLRTNVRVGLEYLEAWLRGRGSVPINNLMEDSATAEICRSQIWQWLSHGASFADGKKVDVDTFRSVLSDELQDIRKKIGDSQYSKSRFELASRLFDEMTTSAAFPEFLTIVCYPELLKLESQGGYDI
jgi:malate synthase